ncbi:MAG: hypothetical protein ACP5H2_11130 [Solirubrobacteraceae bacterium]
MREAATLKLDSGPEVRVEVDPEQLDGDEITVRRAAQPPTVKTGAAFVAAWEQMRPALQPHPAGTTDRLLAADRDRPY